MSSTTSAAPLYVQFAHAIRAEIARLGLPAPIQADTETGFPQNAGYFFVRWDTADSAAIIVPQSKTRMGNLHSHIDLTGFDGHVGLPRKNGRVACHFRPEIRLVSAVLHLFVGASKRPVAPPVRRLMVASVAPAAAAQFAASHPVRIGSAADFELPKADLEVASWASAQAPTSYTDEEAEEALQAMIRQAD